MIYNVVYVVKVGDKFARRGSYGSFTCVDFPENATLFARAKNADKFNARCMEHLHLMHRPKSPCEVVPLHFTHEVAVGPRPRNMKVVTAEEATSLASEGTPVYFETRGSGVVYYVLEDTGNEAKLDQ